MKFKDSVREHTKTGLYVIGAIVVGFLFFAYHYWTMSDKLLVWGNDVMFVYGVLTALSTTVMGFLAFYLWLRIVGLKLYKSVPAQKKLHTQHITIYVVSIVGVLFLMAFLDWAVIRYIILGQPYGGFRAWGYEIYFELLNAINAIVWGFLLSGRFLKNLRVETGRRPSPLG
jgi:hypothetical protein